MREGECGGADRAREGRLLGEGKLFRRQSGERSLQVTVGVSLWDCDSFARGVVTLFVGYVEVTFLPVFRPVLVARTHRRNSPNVKTQ